MVGTSSKKIAAIAALTILLPNTALPQQLGGAGTTQGGTTQGTAQTPATAQAIASAAQTQGTGGGITPSGGRLPNAGGLQIDFGLSSRLSFDDNFALSNSSAGTSTIWDNLLSFNLSNITPRDTLTLLGSTTLRYADIPGRSVTGFEDPTVQLNYMRDGINSQFSVNARYRQADREFLDPFQVEQEEQALGQLIGGGGSITWSTFGMSYVTGINDPLGFQLSLRRNEQVYDPIAEAVNPLLFDRVTDSATATVTARVTPTFQLRGSVGVTEYDAEDAPLFTERRTLDYSVGTVMDINPVLQLDAQIGYTDVTTDTTLGRTTQSGITSAVRLTKTLPNGTIYGDLRSSVNQNGTQTTLSFGRDLQLPSGTFSGSLGVTQTPAGNNRLTGALAYSRVMRSSDVTVSATRSVSTNGANQDVLNTRLNVAYNYAVNTNSSIGLSMNWGRSEGADSSSGIGVTNRTTLNATYSYALTQDWNMTGGLQIRRRDDSSGNAQSNSVFVSLDRNFSFRP